MTRGATQAERGRDGRKEHLSSGGSSREGEWGEQVKQGNRKQ